MEWVTSMGLFFWRGFFITWGLKCLIWKYRICLLFWISNFTTNWPISIFHLLNYDPLSFSCFFTADVNQSLCNFLSISFFCSLVNTFSITSILANGSSDSSKYSGVISAAKEKIIKEGHFLSTVPFHKPQLRLIIELVYSVAQ